VRRLADGYSLALLIEQETPGSRRAIVDRTYTPDGETETSSDHCELPCPRQ